jgi:hypothetical protein
MNPEDHFKEHPEHERQRNQPATDHAGSRLEKLFFLSLSLFS